MAEYEAPSVGFLYDELDGVLSAEPVLVAAGEYLMPLREVLTIEVGERTVYVLSAGADDVVDEAAVRNVMGWDRE